MNKKEYKSKKVLSLIIDLPYFTIDSLSSLDISREYLTILLYRFVKSKKIIRLKRGVYVSSKFINELKKGFDYTNYLELVGSYIYKTSYLSLEYVLAKHGLLSESVFAYSYVSTNKTNKFINELGIFSYQHIKSSLFKGFIKKRIGKFDIYEASLGKALFDYLYLRKNILLNRESVLELRLNLELMKKSDWKEMEGYIKEEGSSKMNSILKFIKK